MSRIFQKCKIDPASPASPSETGRAHVPLPFSKHGMTLIEVMVSLVILSFILAAIFTILNLQTVRSVQVQKSSIMQIDAQIVSTLLKWDLASAGLAYPKTDDAVQSLNGGPMGTDAINLKAVGLGFESGNVKWSWLLGDANSNAILVRGWEGADTVLNFKTGDTVVTIDRARKIMKPPGNLVIIGTQPDSFIDPYGNAIHAQRLTLDNQLNAPGGRVVIGKYSSIYNPGMTIQVIGNQLMRGGQLLLDNVEDLQFAYGIDNAGSGIITTWTDNVPKFATQGRKWAIRYTIVVTSRPMGGYTYPQDSLLIEDHLYYLTTPAQKKMKRAILTGIVAPPNLQP